MTDISRLQVQLQVTKLQNKDNSLYQLLHGIISSLKDTSTEVTSLSGGSGSGGSTTNNITNNNYSLAPVSGVGSGSSGLNANSISTFIPPTIPTLFTPGSVLFAGILGLPSQDNANLFWDDINKRLGIGTASPNEQLELTGNLRIPITSPAVGIIKVGINSFLHSFGVGNTFLGLASGNTSLSTASQNTGVGADSLAALTTGVENVGIGWGSLKAITTGSKNIALGRASLFSNITGNNNVAIGQNSLVSFTGSDTTAIGTGALSNLISGTSCTAIGFNALVSNTVNHFCTAIGTSALGNTIANQNTAIGYSAGAMNTTGADNTYIGSFANAGSNALNKSTAIGKSSTVSQSNHIMLGTDTECVGIAGAARPSTGTGALLFPDGIIPATLGVNTAGIYANDVSGTVNMFGIAEDGTVTRLTWGAPQTYTETNVTIDRTFDANATSLDEIADVLGTLIADLRARGQVN